MKRQYAVWDFAHQNFQRLDKEVYGSTPILYIYIYIKDLGLKDFYCSDFCHMKLMLQINHPVGDLGTHITQTFIWAKGRDVADSGVKFKLYPKGTIASGKQHGCSFERV